MVRKQKSQVDYQRNDHQYFGGGDGTGTPALGDRLVLGGGGGTRGRWAETASGHILIPREALSLELF